LIRLFALVAIDREVDPWVCGPRTRTHAATSLAIVAGGDDEVHVSLPL
jgi:hypothetical protein